MSSFSAENGFLGSGTFVCFTVICVVHVIIGRRLVVLGSTFVRSAMPSLMSSLSSSRMTRTIRITSTAATAGQLDIQEINHSLQVYCDTLLSPVSWNIGVVYINCRMYINDFDLYDEVVILYSKELTADARELKGELYCLPCHDKMGVPICGACRRPIEGRVVNAMGKQWHVEVSVSV